MGDRNSLTLKPIESNLIDEIWENKTLDQPHEVYIHDYKWHEFDFKSKYQ